MDYTCIERILNDPGFPESWHEIRPNQAVSIAAERGTVVRAESGTLWLTQEGNGQDYVLVPGVQYRSPGEGKIVMSAFDTGGAVLVSQPESVSGHRYYGSALRIDRGAVERIEHEARAARGCLMKEWTLKILAGTRGVLRELTGASIGAFEHWLRPIEKSSDASRRRGAGSYYDGSANHA